MVSRTALLCAWLVARRPPDLRVRDYLARWRLLPLNDWFNVYLHRFTGPDARTPHDHPYWSVAIVLTGGHIEHFHDGDCRRIRRFVPVIRSPRLLHWLEPVSRPTWTVFIHFRRVREWGFQTSRGWVHHTEHESQ